MCRFRLLLRGWGSAPLTAAIAKMRNVGWEKHCPVPLQEQPGLSRQRRNAQQIQPAPHQPGDEAGQPEPEDLSDRLVVAHGGELALRPVVERAGGAAAYPSD